IHRSTGDLFALAIPAGEAVGRLGCHLNPCCIGKPYDGALCVMQAGANRFPVQMLSAGVCVIIFASLLWARPKLKREGELFIWFLLLESTSRFGLEFLREPSGPVNGLSSMQWVCLAGAGYAVLKLRKSSEVTTPAE
ncbi:MAG TPA: prolipoprotein diacylglyceryl transferase family protein, partial [Fimbriimonas sp.]|nr:prolipoprotein diacylglyceryl transferase family protein [Fimbriimonas sp.]